MTPKEKAKELVDKYYHLFSVKLENTIADYKAIECALIAVDEMINEYPSQCPKDSYEYERILYWFEVRNEINKL